MDNIDPQLIGNILLKRGFKTFVLYLFKCIEGRNFIVEPLHNELFDYFQDIYENKKLRCSVNLPPRAGKTTIAEYFLVYILTLNPQCQVIYTSYSQSLLGEISSKVANILEHPIYKALFPINIQKEEKEEKPIDEYWRNYLFENTGKNSYTSKVIKTYAGGICLFASCGSQITGYGAGIRNSDKFGGCLIMDDINKPADVTYPVKRNKVIEYYEATLLNRLNNSNVPIINIQQRLHLEDLSGVLINKYNYDLLKIPLLDDEGKCNIPSQYSDERIKELQINNYVFQAQFQQEPILNGGNVIKTDWFKYYQTGIDYNYKRILITADTAMKTKEHNDYSVFVVGGVTPENKLHILDMKRGKWEAPDLKKEALELYNDYKIQKRTGVMCSGLYIEDKASGTGLIQEFKRVGIPIHAIKCESDKLSRVESVMNYIANGNVMLPNNSQYSFNVDLLKECSEFTRDDSHLHDDIVDSLCYCIKEAIAKNNVSLLDFFID